MKDIEQGLKAAFDELFMNDEERKELKLPKIEDIPLALIDPFPDHPFQVRMDEDMNELVESIKERGIITPVTLRRKDDGRYEAIILMVESNLQRSTILPSEKAKSYKMKMEALNRQGKRTDLTLTPVVSKLRSNEELGKEMGESREQIRRYIRLNELIEPILEMVDEGRIAFRPAVEISYLTEQEQYDLLDTMESEDATPSLSQAIKLKQFSKDGRLNIDAIFSSL